VHEYLGSDKIVGLFDVLDDDDSGSITANEFTNGMMQLALGDTDLELAQIKGLLRQGKRSMKRITKYMEQTVALLVDRETLSRDTIQEPESDGFHVQSTRHTSGRRQLSSNIVNF